MARKSSKKGQSRSRKTSKSTRKKAKVKSNKKSKKSMASRRKSFTRKTKRVGKRATNLVNQAKPYMAGVGGGVATEAAVSRVAPQYAQVASYGGAYLFGGAKGLVAKLGLDVLTGRMGNIFGGGSQNNGGLSV